MSAPLVADTGGLLRALAKNQSGSPAWPEYEKALREASTIVLPSLVLAEVDYFLRDERRAMRLLVADVFDPSSTYRYEALGPSDLVRAMVIDAKFADLGLGLVDSAVAAVAERTGIHRVLTIDHDDFVPLRIGERFRTRLVVVP